LDDPRIVIAAPAPQALIAHRGLDNAIRHLQLAGRPNMRALRPLGDIVELINAIAGNQSARAEGDHRGPLLGDAGNGFAALASEVKVLAEQTARAPAKSAANHLYSRSDRRGRSPRSGRSAKRSSCFWMSSAVA